MKYTVDLDISCLLWMMWYRDYNTKRGGCKGGRGGIWRGKENPPHRVIRGMGRRGLVIFFGIRSIHDIHDIRDIRDIRGIVSVAGVN